jgi:hypothetical protein
MGFYLNMEHIELYENFGMSEKKEFTANEIEYYQKLWDWLPQKYRFNPFFSKLWNQVKTKKYLTKKQWTQLEYLLKNGKSQYEAGILPSNY